MFGRSAGATCLLYPALYYWTTTADKPSAVSRLSTTARQQGVNITLMLGKKTLSSSGGAKQLQQQASEAGIGRLIRRSGQ